MAQPKIGSSQIDVADVASNILSDDLSNADEIVTAAGYSANLYPGSRTLGGGPYTNSTGKPLMLSIVVGAIDSGGSQVQVGGTTISSFTPEVGGSPATFEATHSVLVPNGSTYQLIGNGTVVSWYEVQ